MHTGHLSLHRVVLNNINACTHAVADIRRLLLLFVIIRMDLLKANVTYYLLRWLLALLPFKRRVSLLKNGLRKR